MTDGIMSYKIFDYELITDYPSKLIDNGATLYPIVTIKKYGYGISYVTVTAVKAAGTPCSINGYVNNGNIYWYTELY